MDWLRKANPSPFEYQKQRDDQSRVMAYRMRERRLIQEKLIMTGESL